MTKGKDKFKPTGVALTPEEEQKKFDAVLWCMIEIGLPLRRALREVHYGAGKFYDFLEGKDLTKFTGTEIQFKGALTLITEEFIQKETSLRQKQYARANHILVDNIVDETIEIADDGSNDTFEVNIGSETNPIMVTKTDFDVIQRSKMRIETRQWYATKVHAKKYGNKQEQKITGDANNPVQVVVSLGSGVKPPED